MFKKEQGQDDYFNQQSKFLTLSAYISPLNLIFMGEHYPRKIVPMNIIL